MVKTVCAQSCTHPYNIIAGWKMNLSSEARLHTKCETSRSRVLCESSPKSLQKICVMLKLFIFYNFLTDADRRQTLAWSSEFKMEGEKTWLVGWSNSRSMSDLCWAETGNSKCLTHSLPQTIVYSPPVRDSIPTRLHSLLPVKHHYLMYVSHVAFKWMCG